MILRGIVAVFVSNGESDDESRDRFTSEVERAAELSNESGNEA
jgi:hypothetical protein